MPRNRRLTFGGRKCLESFGYSADDIFTNLLLSKDITDLVEYIFHIPSEVYDLDKFAPNFRGNRERRMCSIKKDLKCSSSIIFNYRVSQSFDIFCRALIMFNDVRLRQCEVFQIVLSQKK